MAVNFPNSNNFWKFCPHNYMFPQASSVFATTIYHFRCQRVVQDLVEANAGYLFLCTHGGTTHGTGGCKRIYFSQDDLDAHVEMRHSDRIPSTSTPGDTCTTSTKSTTCTTDTTCTTNISATITNITTTPAVSTNLQIESLKNYATARRQNSTKISGNKGKLWRGRKMVIIGMLNLRILIKSNS